MRMRTGLMWLTAGAVIAISPLIVESSHGTVTPMFEKRLDEVHAREWSAFNRRVEAELRQLEDSADPISADDVFLTDVIVHHGGTMSHAEITAANDGEPFAEWVTEAIARGMLRRDGDRGIRVTDPGRRIFSDSNRSRLDLETGEPER